MAIARRRGDIDRRRRSVAWLAQNTSDECSGNEAANSCSPCVAGLRRLNIRYCSNTGHNNSCDGDGFCKFPDHDDFLLFRGCPRHVTVGKGDLFAMK